MIHLIPNKSAVQAFSVSPYAQRKYLPISPYIATGPTVNYLLQFEEIATGEKHVCRPLVTTDNERQTEMNILTNADDAANAKVLIKNSGLYIYRVYANTEIGNVAINDPIDLDIAGLLETGVARFTAEEVYTTADITIPNNVIYYE